MKTTFMLWCFSRIALVLYAIVAGYSFNPRSNIPWIAALAGPAMFALFLFFWLSSKAADPEIDWTQPFSLTKPFFPMARYPMHSSLLSSTICILIGIASSVHTLLLRDRIGPDTGLILLCGVFTLIASLGFWFSPGNIRNRVDAQSRH
jgi:hypothetical protein